LHDDLNIGQNHPSLSVQIFFMPEKKTIEKAEEDKREGKSPSTQAGEFVREEMEHIREGKHGARNARQAIAIGLSKARRAGVDLKPQKKERPLRSLVRVQKVLMKKDRKVNFAIGSH
jgi:hypothetical protein